MKEENLVDATPFVKQNIICEFDANDGSEFTDFFLQKLKEPQSKTKPYNNVSSPDETFWEMLTREVGDKINLTPKDQ